MTLVIDVAERLAADVPALVGRVEYATDLAVLIAEGAMPQRDVSGFVVPLGFDDLGGNSVAGMHTQMLAESIGVILVIRSPGDTKARKAVPTIEALTLAVITSIAGWAPDNVAGVFRVMRGRLVAVSNGLVIYQIDFSLTDQLRVVR